MKVAVIILNHNSYDDCCKCVSYLKQQKGIELGLIIVDNNSLDQDKIEAFCQEVGCIFIASPENRGYNAGNNIGLRYAEEQGYEYAMIVNPDMEFPCEDYVAKLAGVIQGDSRVVIVGSDIIGGNGEHQNPLKRDGNWREAFYWIKDIFGYRKSTGVIDGCDYDHYCAKVNGCCLLVRMSFIRMIGYFDEYPFLYCEESILSRQVERLGLRMFYTRSTYAIHRHIPSKKGDPIKRVQQWKRSRIYFINNYSGDTWVGKIISILSFSLYAWIFMFIKKRHVN